MEEEFWYSSKSLITSDWRLHSEIKQLNFNKKIIIFDWELDLSGGICLTLFSCDWRKNKKKREKCNFELALPSYILQLGANCILKVCTFTHFQVQMFLQPISFSNLFYSAENLWPCLPWDVQMYIFFHSTELRLTCFSFYGCTQYGLVHKRTTNETKNSPWPRAMVFCYQNCSELLWEKFVLLIKKKFEFANFLRSLEQFIVTVKGQNNFWYQNVFLTCSWRFLISNKSTIRSHIGKKYWDLETCRKS